MDNLKHLLKRYEAKGYEMAGEVLLEPKIALDLLDELEKLGAIILGVDLWRFYGPDRTRLGEYTQGMSMDAIITGPDAANRTANSARKFIAGNLPKEVDLVSFVVRAPDDI